MKKIAALLSATMMMNMLATSGYAYDVEVTDVVIELAETVTEDVVVSEEVIEETVEDLTVDFENMEIVSANAEVSSFASQEEVLEEKLEVITEEAVVSSPASDFTFNFETQTITKYNGTDEHVVIPSAFENEAGEMIDVLYIGNNAFVYNKTIVSVVIPEPIESIGTNAFFGCEKLNSVDLPDTLKIIGNASFTACAFKEFIIPESVTTIEAGAFNSCKSLTEIVIPKGVTIITDMLFEGCTSIESIEILGDVTQIGTRVFVNCTSLKYLNLPDTIEAIYGGAFYGCSSLVELKLPQNLKTLTSVGTSYNMFQGVQLETLVIPENVTYIGTQPVFANSTFKTIYVMQYKEGNPLANTQSSWGVPAGTEVIWLESIVGETSVSAGSDFNSRVITLNAMVAEEDDIISTVTLPNGDVVSVNDIDCEIPFEVTANGTYTFVVELENGTTK